jgi:sugar/nucleoside kinase (ribokinase family)
MTEEQQEFDFVAIGDTVTDAFIKIKAASVFRVEDPEGNVNEELCFTNGAKIPYESVEVIKGVGNSANAAVSAARLGLRSGFVSDVGDDDNGRDILASLLNNNVDTGYVRIHEGMASNYHYVLMHGAERTILIKHQEYPYKLPDMGNPKWLYFSSVGENSLSYHAEIADYLKSHPGVKLAFQPGTFQIKLGADTLKDLYLDTEIFFCNVEEARLILKSTEPEPAKLPRMISMLGPKIAVITDGPKGLYAFDSKSGKTYFMPPYPDPKPPVSRTGAGDACSSTITVALALGKSLPDALEWGPINSMNVVQHVGAQTGLLTKSELEELLAKRPSDYVAKEITE